jgi:hypothetical protein
MPNMSNFWGILERLTVEFLLPIVLRVEMLAGEEAFLKEPLPMFFLMDV